MRERIKRYVRELMKGYKVSDKQLEAEIVSACCDDYEMLLSNGIESEEAFNASIADVDSIIKEKIVPKNKYQFSLRVCCCALIVSIIEILAPKLSSKPLDIYGFEMPICILVLCGSLIYVTVKRRVYHWYDFIVLAVFLLSWVSTNIQIGVYAYHFTMPDRYGSAEYGFPCIIKILTYITDTYPNNVYYKLASVKNIYSFNFILSIVSLIIMSALAIKEKCEKK